MRLCFEFVEVSLDLVSAMVLRAVLLHLFEGLYADSFCAGLSVKCAPGYLVHVSAVV